MVHTTVRLLHNTIREANSSLIKGESTVAKLCKESIRMLDEDDILNSFITICRQESLDTADKLDKKLEKSSHDEHSRKSFEKKGFARNLAKDRDLDDPYSNPLFGIPVSVKDNFCMDQVLTTCGSKMLHNFVPNYTATAVSRLQRANCIILGKTNMDEFAMGSSSTTSYFGPTANHWKRHLLNQEKVSNADPKSWFMAGGSSTGSATSVSSGSCFASLGTDTGGSTRQPASLTGTVGFKPTYGLISRFGLVPLAHSLDVVSLLARNVYDTKLIFDTVVGQDERDLTSVDHEKELKTNLIPKIMTGSQPKSIIRVGVPEDFIAKADLTSDVANLFNRLMSELPKFELDIVGQDGRRAKVMLELIKLDLQYSRHATECYAILSSSEIASNMSCFDGVKFGYSSRAAESGRAFNRDRFYQVNRDEAFGDEVKKRILLGNYFLLEANREKYLSHALRIRRCISEEFSRAFQEQNVDIILLPSTPSTSVSHQEWLEKRSDNKLFHEDYFLIPSNLANLPSINLPAGLSPSGLPIGLQLIANKFHDLDLLFISKLFEENILRYSN